MNNKLSKEEIGEQIGIMSAIIGLAIRIKGNNAFKQGILNRALPLRQELREQYEEMEGANNGSTSS